MGAGVTLILINLRSRAAMRTSWPQSGYIYLAHRALIEAPILDLQG